MDGVVSTPDASRFSNQPASSSPPRADGLSALSTALSAADRSHTEGDCDPRCSPSKTTEDLLAGSSKKGPDEVLDTTPSSVSLMGNAPIEVQSTPDKTELGTVSLLRSPRGAGVTTAAASSLLDSAPFRMIPPSASARRRASSLSSELDRDNISLRHHAEVRAMLVVAERELADARKMCDQRGLRIENLESSLERSRATQQEMRERYAEDMGAVNSEHEAQIIQLRDQLRVLKQVSEGAMADKLQSAAEAEKQKKELLELVDRERQEKSRIMAEYREQTEALIAEQGHEITMLQSALEKVKSEYDLLAREHEKLMDDRSRLQDEVVETQSQIDRERFDAAKLLKDMQTRLLEEREQLREELGVKHEEKLRDSARQNAQYQQLVDQLHNATEALATQNEEHVQEVEQLKYIHLQELRAVQQDLDAVRSAHSTQADSHRAELERVSKREAAAVETLRQAQSAARGEQERLLMETTRQLEELQSQHRAKVGQLQSSIAEVTHEAAVERQRRKDVEAELEVVRLSAEQLEKSLSSLKSQLEESSSDKKVQERLLEQQRQQDVGELQGKLRSLSTDLAYAQQQVQQLNVEQRNLREDLALKTALLEQTKKEHVQALEQMRSEVEHSSQSHNVKEGERQKQVETLKEQKRLVEAALADAQRTLTETAAQLKTSQSKLEEAAVERQATAVRQKDLAVLCEDLRQSLSHEQSRSEAITTDKLDVEQQLQDARLRYEELEVKVALLERKLQEEQLDQQRLAKTHEGKIENLEMRHKAELATQRVSVEQLRNEIGHLRESLAAKEAALRELRETMGQQQRDAAMRDGSVQEVIENLKEAHAAERRKLDELLNDLRSDLAKSQATCSRYEKILSQYNRDSDAQRAELEAALELSEQSRAKLHDDAKCREQLNQELQGTVRLITSRLGAYEEESKQLQTELRETHRKAQDAQTMIGRKEATIGQLQAKLRAYEARGGSL